MREEREEKPDERKMLCMVVERKKDFPFARVSGLVQGGCNFVIQFSLLHQLENIVYENFSLYITAAALVYPYERVPKQIQR